MREWRRTQGIRASLVAFLASAVLAAAPGVGTAQTQSGSDQMSSESKSTSPGATEAPKPPVKSAGEVGDRLHDSAKGFGEALLDGIKYAGNKVINFFTDDDKPKK
jgi:hypothetical protein